jgi:hypothetical protein
MREESWCSTKPIWRKTPTTPFLNVCPAGQLRSGRVCGLVGGCGSSSPAGVALADAIGESLGRGLDAARWVSSRWRR